jgi:thioredoxin reductase (NADPH)
VLVAGVPGGHLANIEHVEDFTGFPEGIPGFELGPKLQEQAANAGAEFRLGEATSPSGRALATAPAATGRCYVAARRLSSAAATQPSRRR